MESSVWSAVGKRMFLNRDVLVDYGPIAYQREEAGRGDGLGCEGVPGYFN